MSNNNDKTYLLKEPLHGIYIPCALIIFGVGIHDLSYIPYAVAFLAVFLSFRLFQAYLRRSSIHSVKWRDFELIDKTIVSQNSAIYRFKLYREEEVLDIPVGHHLACFAAIDGKDEVRYYTPISSQFDTGFFDILVKSYPNGVVSKKFAGLREGEKMKFRGPVGRLNYKPNMAKKIGLIAGGSGITPILQVITSIITTPEDTTEISLLYANETANDILLKGEIDELASKYPYLKVNYILTTPPAKWDGETGYVTKEMIEKYLPPVADANRLFVCGPPAMKKLVIDLTAELGWNKAAMPSKSQDQVFIF